MRGKLTQLMSRLDEEEEMRRNVEERLEESRKAEEESKALLDEILQEKERRAKEAEEGGGAKYRCVVLTDSNGGDATAESIKRHMPSNERESYDIEVIQTFTMAAAYDKIEDRSINVSGAYVVIDCLTNEVRTNRRGPALSPSGLVQRIDRLRASLWAASAAGIVVCELKPMQIMDVSPFNRLLSDYLRAQGDGGHGCRTQISINYIARDGYHIQHQYRSIMDRTYAYALMGKPVPCPIPPEDFIPFHVRRSWENEWPMLGVARDAERERAYVHDHGWIRR